MGPTNHTIYTNFTLYRINNWPKEPKLRWLFMAPVFYELILILLYSDTWWHWGVKPLPMSVILVSIQNSEVQKFNDNVFLKQR
jgi:hypothetical protein